jgi:hypothetical protein
MLNLDKTMILIEHLRDEMISTFNKKGNVIDGDVLQVSRMLDSVLNHYYFLIKKDEAF